MFKGLFGPKDTRTPDEKYQDMKKDLRANVRSIDRQIRTMEREQKKVDADIKKSAKSGASPAVLKAKCKSRVLLQHGIEKMIAVRANIESMVTTITVNKAQILQMEAMKKGAITMKLIGEGMDPKEMQQVAAEFQKEMMRNDINMELMDIGPEPESELVDEEMDKVLMEVAGVKMSDIGLAGAHALPSQQADAARMSAALPDVPHYMEYCLKSYCRAFNRQLLNSRPANPLAA
ncbi:hypothetical protein JH06_4467 [Blastocystis sp. subtype 4]|uniref:hypothetical protein n=1 Tax=Blastocystis sp. subtype 4 TaxID=944170 RepID=UPI0007112ABB|nr:hypothetical protein JH06_4467 [Blastocystis sp. subtype 4]KNB41991.1 hypothetical protein JH06_4467 [Blastocystis sp. subtype 4]|eukprot:XP_014525434.1 hypothetical protein JH06_4467 [Blastocystis sp. subtype 4]